MLDCICRGPKFESQLGHITVVEFDIGKVVSINLCPAEPGYTLPANSVDPDQLASEEVN